MRKAKSLKQALMVLFMTFCMLMSINGDLSAQNVLSLDDALSIALNRSNEIKSTRFDLEQNQLLLEARLRDQRTRIDLSWSAPNWEKKIKANPLDDGTISYFDENTLTTTANLQIIQPILLTNSTFSIRGGYATSDVENEVSPGVFKSTQSWRDELTLYFEQPLFQPNNQKITLNRTRRNLELSQRGFDDKQNDIYFQVISKYYSLVRSKTSLEIERETLAQNEDTYENTMNKYRAGIMAEVSALQAKVNLDEARVNFEKQNLAFRRELDNFKLYIGVPLSDPIDIEDVVSDIRIVSINQDKALSEAMANNMMLNRLEIQKLNQVDQIELEKNNRKIKADLSLEYGLNEIDNLSYPLRDQLFKDMNNTNNVMLNFTLPVFDWGAQKRRVESQYVEMKSIEEDLEYSKIELRNQVQELVDRVNNNRALMEIQAQSEEIAEKSYSITVERYDIGEIDIETLYQDNERLKRTKLSVLNAKIDYLTSVAQLSRVTYWDFANNRPLRNTLARFIQN